MTSAAEELAKEPKSALASWSAANLRLAACGTVEASVLCPGRHQHPFLPQALHLFHQASVCICILHLLPARGPAYERVPIHKHNAWPMSVASSGSLCGRVSCSSLKLAMFLTCPTLCLLTGVIKVLPVVVDSSYQLWLLPNISAFAGTACTPCCSGCCMCESLGQL